MNNKILKTELVEWEKLELFQPADLKKMSKNQLNKLKTSLKQNGFKTPFYVWQNKDKIYCLDGHQRIPILKLLKDEGEIIPDKLPANFIDCKNIEDAKKAVLIFNSHYADFQKDDLLLFVKDIDFEDINIPFDFGNFLDFNEAKVIEKELKPYDKYHILISYSNLHLIEIQKIMDLLKEIPGIEIEQSAN